MREPAARGEAEIGERVGGSAPVHDVVIVGGGPVGMLAAVLLAQAGVDVVVLEKRTEISQRPRAIGIHPPAVRALAAAGIDVTHDGERIDGGIARADGRVLGRMRFRNPVFALPQQDVERMLRDRLAALRPGALRLGHTVTGLERRDSVTMLSVSVSVSVSVSGAGSGSGSASVSVSDSASDSVSDSASDSASVSVSVSAREGTLDATAAVGDARAADPLSAARNESRIAARIVVGADGIESTVRRASGIRWRKRPGQARYAMADIVDSRYPNLAVLSFERGGVVESFPLAGGRRRWVALLDDRADLAAVVAERTGETLDIVEAPVSVFVARQHRAQRLLADGVVLIGDAAHEVSPIGGQGLNLGWLDAQALAALLSERVTDGENGRTTDAATGRPLASPTQWRRFERARQASARRAMAQAAFNMGVGRALPDFLHAVRCFGIRILALPPARTLLADAFTMRRR